MREKISTLEEKDYLINCKVSLTLIKKYDVVS